MDFSGWAGPPTTHPEEDRASRLLKKSATRVR